MELPRREVYLVQITYCERNTDTEYPFVARGEFGINAGSVNIACMLSSQRKIYLDCQPEEQIRTEIYERSRQRASQLPRTFPLDTSVSSHYHITN